MTNGNNMINNNVEYPSVFEEFEDLTSQNNDEVFIDNVKIPLNLKSLLK
jgi:hypothetical protein